jgi:glycosyltransferase involved in cell wall biosynthesis
MQGMRIAVIAADLIPERLGGAEVHTVELIKRLAEKGHSFDIFVGSSAEIAKIFPKHVTVYPVSYPRVPNLFGISYILFAPFQIKKALRNRQIDLLWAKQVYPQGVVAAILAKFLKKPLYMTAQNPLDYKEELVMKGMIPFQSVWPNALTPIVSFALRKADVVACVSRYAEEQARKLGAKRTVLIPNGVNVEKFKSPRSRASSLRGKEKFKRKAVQKVRIVSTSALIPRNGLDTLIDAVALLPKRFDWELVIAGDGPEEKNLKSQISYLKLEKRVKLVGRVENKNIPQLLASADLFVRLSRKEGFGVSFLEAMAAGVPIIATSVGGIPDFVLDGKTGMLVAPDHPYEAAQSMKRVLEDPELRGRLTRNARTLVKNRYNWDTIADEVKEVFRTLA